MVIWSQYLTNVATFLNTTETQAGTISSLIFTIGLILLSLVATKGKKAIGTVPITTFFSVIFFTFIGWFPVWTGSVLSLVLAIFIGVVFTGFLGRNA